MYITFAGYIPNSVVRHTLQIHKPRPPEKPKDSQEFPASDRLRAVSNHIANKRVYLLTYLTNPRSPAFIVEFAAKVTVSAAPKGMATCYNNYRTQ